MSNLAIWRFTYDSFNYSLLVEPSFVQHWQLIFIPSKFILLPYKYFPLNTTYCLYAHFGMVFRFSLNYWRTKQRISKKKINITLIFELFLVFFGFRIIFPPTQWLQVFADSHDNSRAFLKKSAISEREECISKLKYEQWELKEIFVHWRGRR